MAIGMVAITADVVRDAPGNLIQALGYKKAPSVVARCFFCGVREKYTHPVPIGKMRCSFEPYKGEGREKLRTIFVSVCRYGLTILRSVLRGSGVAVHEA